MLFTHLSLMYQPNKNKLLVCVDLDLACNAGSRVRHAQLQEQQCTSPPLHSHTQHGTKQEVLKYISVFELARQACRWNDICRTRSVIRARERSLRILSCCGGFFCLRGKVVDV